MSKTIEFSIEPFVYKMTLHDSVLRIVSKHMEECYVWSTIIDGMLMDPDTVKNDSSSQKQFVVNLDPDEIFDLFESYKSGVLDNSVKITFPTMYKNENEHICIVVDIQRTFGKQRHDTKWIILSAENIAKDLINYQKIEHFKIKTISKLHVVENLVQQLEQTVSESNQKVVDMKNEMDLLLKQLLEMTGRLSALETKHTSLGMKHTSLETKHTSLESTVSDIESTVDELESDTRVTTMDVNLTAIKLQQTQLDTYNTVDKLKTVITTLCDTKYALKV